MVVQVRLRPPLDIWSAGLVLFELFAGRPFFGEDVTYAQIAAMAATGVTAEAVHSRVREWSLRVSEAQGAPRESPRCPEWSLRKCPEALRPPPPLEARAST